MTPEERLVALIGEKEAVDLLLLLRAAIEEGRAQARAEALEEAAKEADEWRNMCDLADFIAAAIRALKDGEPRGDNCP